MIARGPDMSGGLRGATAALQAATSYNEMMQRARMNAENNLFSAVQTMGQRFQQMQMFRAQQRQRQEEFTAELDARREQWDRLDKREQKRLQGQADYQARILGFKDNEALNRRSPEDIAYARNTLLFRGEIQQELEARKRQAIAAEQARIESWREVGSREADTELPMADREEASELYNNYRNFEASLGTTLRPDEPAAKEQYAELEARKQQFLKRVGPKQKKAFKDMWPTISHVDENTGATVYSDGKGGVHSIAQPTKKKEGGNFWVKKTTKDADGNTITEEYFDHDKANMEKRKQEGGFDPKIVAHASGMFRQYNGNKEIVARRLIEEYPMNSIDAAVYMMLGEEEYTKNKQQAAQAKEIARFLDSAQGYRRPTSQPASSPSPEQAAGVPQTQPAASQPAFKDGETKTINGVTYKRVDGVWKRQ